MGIGVGVRGGYRGEGGGGNKDRGGGESEVKRAAITACQVSFRKIGHDQKCIHNGGVAEMSLNNFS